MKTKILAGCLTGLFMFGMAGIANAYSSLIGGTSAYTVTDRSASSPTDIWDAVYMGYTGSDYSGYYLGTIAGNDSESDLESLVGYYLDGVAYDVDYFSKVDAPATSNADGLVITIASGGKSGTWDTTAITPAVSLEFYAIKASNEYALYFLDPAEQTGAWTSRHTLNNGGQQPAISHYSSSLVTNSPTPAPEPATMLLFGTGLASLVGVARRKRNKE